MKKLQLPASYAALSPEEQRTAFGGSEFGDAVGSFFDNLHFGDFFWEGGLLSFSFTFVAHAVFPHDQGRRTDRHQAVPAVRPFAWCDQRSRHHYRPVSGQYPTAEKGSSRYKLSPPALFSAAVSHKKAVHPGAFRPCTAFFYVQITRTAPWFPQAQHIAAALPEHLLDGCMVPLE